MTLAVVDDDDDVRTALNRLLRAIGYRVVAFASAEEFEAAASRWIAPSSTCACLG